MKTYQKIINGIEYQAVWNGMNYQKDCIRRCSVKGTQRLSRKRLADIIFSEVIISPKVNMDDFDDMAVFWEVYDFGESVLFGDYERIKSESRLKKKVTDEMYMWRLVYCDMSNFTYDEVFNRMTPQEIDEANIALDIVGAEIKKQTKTK